jgi:hypothetical protein
MTSNSAARVEHTSQYWLQLLLVSVEAAGVCRLESLHEDRGFKGGPFVWSM